MQLINQENRLVMAAPVIGLKSQPHQATGGRLRTLHSYKAKVSETVSSSKEVGTLGLFGVERLNRRLINAIVKHKKGLPSL